MAKDRLLRSRWAAIGAAIAVSLGAGGVLAAQAATNPSTTASTNFVPLSPNRILDTRTGVGTPKAKLGAGQTITLSLFDPSTGVPGDATSVVLNITATGGTATSYLTVYPEGDAKPNASAVNINVGIDSPNMITAKIGDNGNLKIFNNAGSVDVIADVAGYFHAATDQTVVRFGQFDSAGTQQVGNLGINMPHQSVGFYKATGGTDWLRCTMTVSVNDSTGTGRYAVVERGAFPSWIYVHTYTAAGALVDAPFSLVETCPGG